MKYIDVHSHVQFAAFDEDREVVVNRTQENEVGMINVGTQYDTSYAAVKLAAERAENNWATIGLHPIHTSRSFHDVAELGGEGKTFISRGEEFNYEAYKELGAHPKVVGIGEVGIDYYRVEEHTKEIQFEVFQKQILLANELNKPLMLHIRTGRGMGGGAAYDDALKILKATAKVQGNCHFFAGDWATAKKFLKLDFTLSFTGVLTFTPDYDEVVKKTPLDMILTETDCPYITPVPYRGQRNEPKNVHAVVEAIARIKGEDVEKVRLATIENAKRVFKLE